MAATRNCWKRGLVQEGGDAGVVQELRGLHGAVWGWEQDGEARHDV